MQRDDLSYTVKSEVERSAAEQMSVSERIASVASYHGSMVKSGDTLPESPSTVPPSEPWRRPQDGKKSLTNNHI
jgi:hypothetical protein